MNENIERFDKAAKEWDSKQTRITMATKITSQIIKNIPLKNEHTVMDFGCGTGLVGLSIAPLVKKLIGVDISSAMIDTFKAKAIEQGLCNVEARNTDDGSLSNLCDLDAIVSAMALHHIKEPSSMFKNFADSLKSGGYLGVADLDKEDGSFHENNNGVYHFGFCASELEDFFVSAGFEKPQITVAHTIDKELKSYDILFCFARKI